MYRTIEWLDDTSEVRLVDQTKLPLTLDHVVTKSHERIAKSIKIMEIRGAPAREQSQNNRRFVGVS
ncbi:MAG: hypothetical protein ACXABM_16530 [Candidatus Thorarchaeota archaeon]|jgi:methylthioribose-1-phosphate isomerase